MDIRDYYMREKSEIQKAKDKILENMMKQQGLYDLYYLGQISVVESLVNYIDKDYCKILLKSLVDSSETSDEIKKLSSNLFEKYSKEPKFEL
jgi:hypothetical protein